MNGYVEKFFYDNYFLGEILNILSQVNLQQM